jgi:hypothetical protein
MNIQRMHVSQPGSDSLSLPADSVSLVVAVLISPLLLCRCSIPVIYPVAL